MAYLVENARNTQHARVASGWGTIYSYTVVQEAPAGYEHQAPYILALVKLDEGNLVTAQITDVNGPINIGDRVEMVTRKLTTDGTKGMIVYGFKFRRPIQ
jgi:hypothetical protein